MYARKHGVRLLHTLCLDALWMLEVSYSGRARKKKKDKNAAGELQRQSVCIFSIIGIEV